MKPKYEIKPGRVISKDGNPICSINSVYTISPAELDEFAREIVDSLNTVDFLQKGDKLK